MRTIFIIPLIMEVIVNFTKNQWPWLNKFKIVQRCSGSFRDVTFYFSTAALRFSPMRNTPKVDCRTAPTTCGLLWALIVFWGCGKDTPFVKEHHFELAAEIPIGKTTVEILQMRYSERTEELSQRMSVTVATNKVWWFDYLKKHIDEHPLPYHTNLGLTKLEYTELLEGYEKTRRLQKVSDAYLIFKRKGDLLSIDIGDANSPIEQWRLNLLSGKLFTPMGDVEKPEWRTGDDPKQPLGVYEGYRWHYENGDAQMTDLQISTLSMFRLKASGMIFCRLEDSIMHNNDILRSTDLVFRYDPKQRAGTGRR